MRFVSVTVLDSAVMFCADRYQQSVILNLMALLETKSRCVLEYQRVCHVRRARANMWARG